MAGLGTVINVLCIVGGGILGLIAKKLIKPSLRDTLMSVTGVGIMLLGIGGVMSQMLSVADGKLISGGTVMMIASLALGTITGELLQIEKGINRFGEWLKVKSRSTGDGSFVCGFVSASCTVCVGAMAVIGSIQDGISGDCSVLVAKSVLDAIIICIMAAASGKGCVFSAIPVGIIQGLITLLAFFVGDFMPAGALSNLSYVGSALIFCVGLNLIREKQIRVANTLPSIIFAIAIGWFF